MLFLYIQQNTHIDMRRNIKNDLAGQKFGHLLGIKPLYKDKTYHKYMWAFICELCGNGHIASGIDVKRGRIKSCGCLKNTREKNGLWKGYYEISGSTYGHYKEIAEKRGIEFSVSIEDLWNQYINQNERCVYTNIKLILSSTNNISSNGSANRTPLNASLDRIDSDKGYIPGNVQWVFKPINIMKGSLSHVDFIRICKLIYDNNKNESFNDIDFNSTHFSKMKMNFQSNL